MNSGPVAATLSAIGAATLLQIILKVAGGLAASWWLVLAPLLALLALLGVLLIVMVIIGIVAEFATPDDPNHPYRHRGAAKAPSRRRLAIDARSTLCAPALFPDTIVS